MGAVDIVLDRVMPYPENDYGLLQRIAAGDERALHGLYAAYGQRLYAYALRLTNDPAAAEEVLQDSLVAVWQGAGRFRGESRVLTWLLGIVHHKAVGALRKRRLPLLDDEEDEEPPASEPLPEEQAALGEQADLLRAGLERLSPKHRMVLELVFYQGLSLAEVAEVTGCPVGTVKSRLSYAKASLRQVLKQDGLRAEDIA